jgi:hypothetical protein
VAVLERHAVERRDGVVRHDLEVGAQRAQDALGGRHSERGARILASDRGEAALVACA